MSEIKRYTLIVVMSLLYGLCTFADNVVHVVVVGDTNDEKIGTAVKTDLRLFDSFVNDLKTLALSNGYVLKTYTLTGNKCSPQSVNEAIKGLDARNDVIIFYYSGHGGRSHSDDATTRFPRMCLGSSYADQWIKVSDALNRFRSKEPKFILMITDCCNSYYDRKRTTESVTMFKAPNGSKVLRKLFFESTGYASITGASPGEYGWCTQDGAYLTLSFLSLLGQVVSADDSSITWQQFLQYVSDDTFKTTNEKYKKGWIGNSQRPVFEVNAQNNSDPSVDDDSPSHDNPTDSVYDNPDEYNDNPDEYNSDDNGFIDTPDSNTRPRYGIGNILTFLISVLLGWLLIMKIPDLLKLEGLILIVVRLIGIIIVVRALLVILGI